MKRSVSILAICAVVLLFSGLARAAVTDLNPGSYATGVDNGPQDGVFDAFAPANLGSVNNNGWTSFRTAAEFDLSGIPSGSVITSAQLTMVLGNPEGTRSIAVHGYAGDGTVQLGDFALNGLIGTTSVGPGGGSLSFDVTGFVSGLAASGKAYAGFNVREDPANSFNYMIMYIAGTPVLTVTYSSGLTVNIDIKPGSFPNSINLGSDGKIPVAILSSPDFNAPSRVDRTSLTFGRTGDEQSLISCDARGTDVNKDRLPDLVCTFDTERTGFTTTDTAGILKGRTKEGQPIVGQDSIRIVPPPGAGDKTPPIVIATTPMNGAIGVAITTMVTATFSEPMNCSTLTTATFLLRDASSMSVPGTVACNSSTATFTPAAALAYGMSYTAVITTGAKDLAGNALASDYAWSFTTATPPDTTPPTVLVTDPTGSAVGVPVTTTVMAVFSEPVDCATVSTATFRLRDALNSLVTGTTSCSGSTAVFTPSAPLAYSMTHRAVLTTGVKDLAGNAMTSSYVWYFTTAALPDTTPPTVLVTDPTGSAVGVPVTTTVMAVFSEPVDCATVSTATFRLREDTPNSPLVTGTTSCSAATAVFTPSAPLAYGMTYRAVLTTGIKDLAGNAMTSSYVWRFSTVAPSPHSISGTVSLSGGAPLPGAMVTLTGAANAATTTAANGSYSFAGLMPGTYTITPSMTGYVFTPATVNITNADVTQDFTAISAVPSYSVSGTVNYTGGRSGRIYVSLRFSGGGGEPGRGTSIEMPGSFTIRGVQPGTYNIYAWMDTIGNGIQNIANPSGMSMGTFTVSGSDVPGISITMTDPVLPPPSVPGGLGATPMDGAAVVYWNTIGNPSGRGDGATAYRVSWSLDGGATFPNSVIVQSTNNGVYFHDGLANGQVLSYRVSSFIEGAESAPSPAAGPITIGAPTGGVSVSGTVTFTGNAAGHRLWIVIADDKSGAPTFVSAVRIADPVSPQGFTIPGIPPGNYILFPFVDMDDNGWFNTGDKMLDMNSFRTFPQVTVAGADVTGLGVQLSEVNATAGVATLHDLRAYYDGYGLSFAVGDQIKRAVMVTIMSGLNIPLPVDLDRNWGSHYTEVLLGTVTPAVGDAYTFKVTYADGTSETLMASVTGVIGPDGMATPTSPVGPGASTVPTLIWAPPLSPPPGGFTYSVGVAETFGPWIWSYPNNGMPSTQTSVVYNIDGSASQPVLASGTTYDWWVQVKDSNANKGSRQASFTTGMGYTYTISGTVTNASADQAHPILIGACQDPSFTICTYGTMLPPGAGGPYTIMGVPAGTYYVGAAVDSNGNGIYDPGIDPVASFAANPVAITNASVMGIDMTIPGGPDLTPPTVVATSPVNGASGVPVTVTLSATFSEPVDCASLASSFSLRDSLNTAVTGSGTCSGTFATFTPSAPLAYSTTYTAVFAAGLKDLAGNSTTMDYISSFTTAPPPIVGEDYWVTAYNTCSYSWPAKPIDQYTEDDWALVRSSTAYILNWRGRATLGPRDANGNGLFAITDFWEHRHQVDQSFGSEAWGITPGTGATIFTTGYMLAPNNELIMTVDGSVFHMALSRDGNFFTGVLRESGNNCQNMLMAVRAATAPVTVSGLYSLVNNYSILLNTEQLGIPGPNPAADTLTNYGQMIWADQSATPARSGISDYLQTYPVTQSDAGGHTADQMITGGARGPETTDADGTLTVATGQGVWHAVSPDGQIRITAQGTNDYVLSSSGSTTLYRHTLGNQLSLRQDPAVTFTASDVIGTYFLSGRRDDVAIALPGTIGTIPPPSCALSTADEPGSAACGTGVHPRWKMTWGYVTFNTDGAASMNLTEFNDQQQEMPVSYSGTYTVRKECFGNSGTSRLPWDDPVCSVGRILDVLVINDGITDIAKFFIGSGGDVLEFYDPTGFTPAAGLAGQRRWVGAAVRLKEVSATYSISGTVTNASADQSHNILIGACQDSSFTICSYATMLPPGPGGAYSITGIPAGTYYMGTCVDSNNDNMCVLGNGEPQTAYGGNPVVITIMSYTGIDMTIPGVVDTSPPAVVLPSPANGTAAASVSAPVTARFSERVNCSTVTSETFRLRDAVLTAVSGTVKCSGASATFVPDAPLAYGTTYTASISAGITDLAGNAMTADYLWSFTTSAPPVIGGDYWVISHNVCPHSWPAKPVEEYTEDDWAQVRSSTEYILNWRGRATLTEPDANGNGQATFTDFWEHRHNLYEGISPGGITPGTGSTMVTIGYTLAPSNEFTMSLNGDQFHMVMSRDYSFFTGVHREAGNACQNVFMAVKAATSPVTVSGLFTAVNYYNFLNYLQSAGMPSPDPAATSMGTYSQVIWADHAVPNARFAFTDYLQVYDPTLAGASGHAADWIIAGSGQGPFTTDPDGTLTVSTNQGVWHAVSPDGRLRITAQGTNDSYPPASDGMGNTNYNHMLGSQLSLKQDPNITFSAADVIGTYFLAARRDDVSFTAPGTIGMVPPNACANSLNDEPGSATCGTGVHPRWRTTWGQMVFSTDGTANVNFTEFNDQQQETPLTATGTFTVRKECFGNSGTSRLPWNDPVCAGGRLLNVLVINIGGSNVAKFFIGNGGDVLSFYDPTGFTPIAGLAGQSRWVGSAVRLK